MPAEKSYSPTLQTRPWRVQENQVLHIMTHKVEQESILRSRIHSHYFPLDPDDNPVGEAVGNEAQRG